MTAARVAAALRSGLREYRRTPVLVALLVFLPTYFVLAFRYMMPAQDLVLPATDHWPRTATTLVDAYAVIELPMIGAILGGVAGLFLVQLTAAADRRLVVAGYRPHEVLSARFGMLVAAAAVVTLVGLGVVLTGFTPAHPGWFAAATLLAAVTYGLVGVVAGRVLSRLAGVYVMLFAPSLDMFLFQNPTIPGETWFAPLLPGHYAVTLAVSAGFAPAVDAAVAVRGLGYAAVLAVVAGGVVYRGLRR